MVVHAPVVASMRVKASTQLSTHRAPSPAAMPVGSAFGSSLIVVTRRVCGSTRRTACVSGVVTQTAFRYATTSLGRLWRAIARPTETGGAAAVGVAVAVAVTRAKESATGSAALRRAARTPMATTAVAKAA